MNNKIVILLLVILTCSLGVIAKSPQVNIIESVKLDAYSDGISIYITRGMLNFLEKPEYKLMVLRHEQAHIVLRHLEQDRTDLNKACQYANDTQVCTDMFYSMRKATAWNQELNADKLAIQNMIKDGYNQDICNIFDKFLTIRKDNPNSISHPTMTMRKVQCFALFNQ